MSSAEGADLQIAGLSLFLPFYTPRDKERALELRTCLKKNLNCGVLDRIYLLQDDDTILPFKDERLIVLHMAQRPTYLDWVQRSRQLCPDHISILANSDIYFQDDITKLRKTFAAQPNSFVALSRYDQLDGSLVPHANPHWSQDTWAFLPGRPLPNGMEAQLDIPLGTPRCDNKIAYVFSINGFDVINPFEQITSVHLHETGLRYYDKRGDTGIKGGMAMVHPSATLTEPAKLDIEIWSLNSQQYTAPRINRSLEKWQAERQRETQIARRVIGFDSDWQYPAVTEKHAFAQMQGFVDRGGVLPEDTVYLGFPWATLIDLSTHAQHRKDKIAGLNAQLDALAKAVEPYKRVITVCQHIRMRQFPQFLEKAGVTDVYWTHTELDQTAVPEAPQIALHPFPLFPVQQVPAQPSEIHAPRPVLFSFVGVKSSKIYMTQSRNIILDELKGDTRGQIIDRNQWHYNKVVYDKQILDRAEPKSGPLENDEAAKQFKEMLSQSLFTLCPSGTGPNSIRLWEAALNGSIPVVLSDRYRPPYDQALWDMATVPCAETPEAIRALPARLEAIRADTDALQRKQLALYLLSQKYGPSRFVHDILESFRTSS